MSYMGWVSTGVKVGLVDHWNTKYSSLGLCSLLCPPELQTGDAKSAVDDGCRVAWRQLKWSNNNKESLR